MEAYGPVPAGKLRKWSELGSRNTMSEFGDRFFPFPERTETRVLLLFMNKEEIM
jgi:hypothetical protein